MPSDYCFSLDNHQGGFPVAPNPSQPDPEHSIGWRQLEPFWSRPDQSEFSWMDSRRGGRGALQTCVLSGSGSLPQLEEMYLESAGHSCFNHQATRPELKAPVPELPTD